MKSRNSNFLNRMTIIGLAIGTFCITLVMNVSNSISFEISSLFIDNNKLIQVQLKYPDKFDIILPPLEFDLLSLDSLYKLDFIESIYINTGVFETLADFDNQKVKIDFFEKRFNITNFYNIESSLDLNKLGFYDLIIESNLFKKLGKPSKLIIKSRNFNIIGTFSSNHKSMNNSLIVNSLLFSSLFEDRFDAITLLINSKIEKTHISQIEKYLSDNFQQEYSVFDYSHSKAHIEKLLSNILNIFLFFGVLVIVVAGISIMNLMFITIINEKNEICIKRAIGATSIDIVKEYLIKSLVFSLKGAIIGAKFGYIISFLILSFIGINCSFTMIPFLFAAVFSMSSTLIFSFYPAYRAGTDNIINYL